MDCLSPRRRAPATRTLQWMALEKSSRCCGWSPASSRSQVRYDRSFGGRDDRMAETRITVAHSPDSDDAFMFFGLASGNVDTGGIVVDQVLSDIETLNRAAFDGKYEVTAVSFHAFAHLSDKYALLPHGASMGDNYGPMVVVRQDGPTSLDGVTVAIPGLWTSAWLALQMYQSGLKYVVMLIHEGQLTYGDEGLRLLVDLGVWWAERTGGLPLPLGGNLIRRDLGPAMMKKVSRMLHASIAHALTHRAEALEYAKTYGRGLAHER